MKSLRAPELRLRFRRGRRSPAAPAVDPHPTPATTSDAHDWRDLGDRVRLLRGLPLLRGLSWDVLVAVAESLEAHEWPEGTVVYHQGDPAERMYVVVSGRALADAGDRPDAPPTAELVAGQSFGDAALWHGTYRRTTTVVDTTRAWSLSSTDADRLACSHPALDHLLRTLRGLDLDDDDLATARGGGLAIRAVELSQWVGGDKRVLHDVSFSIQPGELVAIVGGSGAGKSTLLDALSGVRPAATGTVFYGELDAYEHLDTFRASLGYVPQDDIIHRELSVGRTLEYAARLRLPQGTGPDHVADAVTEVLEALDLGERAGVQVGSLSGGQRKRVSIGVELLTKPRVFFLDEPTSGLDPAIEADLMRVLRVLADGGATVVLTTHVTQDIAICDKVVVLARDGHLTFVGSPDGVLEHFQAENFEEVYERLAQEATPAIWARRFREMAPAYAADGRDGNGDASPATASAQAEPSAAATTTEPRESHEPGEPRRADSDEEAPAAQIGALAQWWILTRRNFEILTRSKLTLAILIGSPALVVIMFAVLFQPGAFDIADPSPNATVMILYWVAFGGFFFGLTYGLLQICTELPVVRRERLVNLRIGPYVLSKFAVLVPLLLLVDVVMLGILRAFDRLPAADAGVYLSLGTTLLLDALAALALGLLTSAAVSRPEQATIALPMLCFPQVLFSGAILPVPAMATVGKVLSFGMSDRYAFEALGHTLDVERLWGEGASPLGPPLLAEYGDTFARSATFHWAVLAGFTVVFLVMTGWVLARKCSSRPGRVAPASA